MSVLETPSCSHICRSMGVIMNTLIGQKFNQLTVLEAIPVQSKTDKRYRTHYKCKCICGNERILTKTHLISGSCKTCGCRKKLCNKKSLTWKGYEEIPAKYFNNLKHHAIILRNIKFELTIEQIWDLFITQNRKCALSGVELSFKTKDSINNGTASLDRIDSNKNYTIDNVQWIHKDLNWIKNKFPQDQFLDWVERIYLYKKDYYSSFNCSKEII